MSTARAERQPEVILAQFEIRAEGKHSSAEHAHTFIVEARREELDQLKRDAHANGYWAEWISSGPMSPAEARAEYAWAFERSEESRAQEAVAPDARRSSKGRGRSEVEDLLETNADVMRAIERQRATGAMASDDAERAVAYWRAERAELEAELAEFAATPEGSSA